MPKGGKAELDKSDWLETAHMKDAPKIKRACSNVVNLATVAATVGLIYTTTPITVTAAALYRITSTVGTAGAIDIGINGDDDSIVSAEGVGVGASDTLVPIATGEVSVEAGKIITASVETAVGTSGTAVLCIEYREDN